MSNEHPRFLSTAITSWQNVLRTLVLVAGISLALWFLFLAGINTLDSRKVKIISGETSILIGENRIESILVHPRGWVDTGIQVKKGDLISTRASGSINLATGRLVTKLSQIYESVSISDEHQGNFTSTISNNANEKLLDFAWVGPEGDPGTISPYFRDNQDIYKKKKLQFIDPRGNHGAMLFLVSKDGVLPRLHEPLDDSQILAYSNTPTQFIAKHGGHLYIAANDEVILGDEIRTQVYWQDNIGHFAVTIVVESQ